MRIVTDEMRGYYERRAREYDDWWIGSNTFRGAHRPGWAEEVRDLIDVVEGLSAARVLDVACGTGFLTCHLHGTVTALDQSPTMAEIARARLPDAEVIRGEAAPLPFAGGAFDRLFTSHFYGHLQEPERRAFVREAHRCASELVVVDSAVREGIDAEQWQERVLGDGSRHRVYKRYFEAGTLAAELGGGDVLHSGRWFVVVTAGSLESSAYP